MTHARRQRSAEAFREGGWKLAAAAVATIVLLVLLVFPASREPAAQGLPTAGAQELGFSADRLGRLDAYMQREVDSNRIAGLVTMILRHGKVAHLRAYGQADRERRAPMRTDSMFRIASMSKPVTIVAVMMLMEEGKLLITDPVSKYIPAFKNTTVAVRPEGGSSSAPYTVVPAKREITIKDLLTHTSGIGYGQGAADRYKAANVLGYYHSDKKETIGQVVERIATLPFEAQPGERWINGFSTDTLGYVVEKISGMPLDQFFKRRIFDPLRMPDSYFFLPKEKAGRLAAVYMIQKGELLRAPDGGTGQGDFVDGPRMAFAGGAGLVSTAADYGRFAQMLLNGGELDGVRLLGPKTIELMTTNHVGNLYALRGSNSTAAAIENRIGRGFGFNFELTMDLGEANRIGSPGDYGWYGAYFPRFWVDPAEKMVAVFMAQLTPSGGSDLHDKFRSLVYQSIVRSEYAGQARNGER